MVPDVLDMVSADSSRPLVRPPLNGARRFNPHENVGRELLVKIGGAYQRIFFMIDMLRDVEFGAVFMDSLSSISRKVYDAVVSLKNMADAFPSDPNALIECSETISRIEREVDEEHIIICRQISVATEGHPDYVVYLMRKIVGELERITDNLLDFAETVEGF